jgi:hypothetical protein
MAAPGPAPPQKGEVHEFFLRKTGDVSRNLRQCRFSSKKEGWLVASAFWFRVEANFDLAFGLVPLE